MGRSADEMSEEGVAGQAEAKTGVPREEVARFSECNGNGRAKRGDRGDP